MTTQIINLSNKNVTLTAYILDSSNEMINCFEKPAVLICPGGGYYCCSDREAEPVAMQFLNRGYNVFILRYSLGENSLFPKPLDDAKEAYDLILSHSKQWHIIKEKIAICGFSAGGHLAAAFSVMNDKKPAACILGYPCILSNLGDVLANPVPALDVLVDEKTPPAFIVAASDDDCVPIENTLKYVDALNKNNIQFELHIFDKGGHGFSTADRVSMSDKASRNKNSRTKRWTEMCLDWLDELFKLD